MTASYHPLRTAIDYIDAFSDFCGRCIAWLTLLMVIITCLVVVLRYGFGIGSIFLQESVSYMHAIVFMLGAGFTLQRQGHVRVDIFYRRMSVAGRAWVDSLGSILFLLPICVFLFAMSWQYVVSAWQIHEGSAQAGGIPAVYLLKSLIPLMAVSLGLQGIADILRNLVTLMEAAEHD